VSSHNSGSSKRRSGASPLRAGWIRNAPIRRKLAMIIVIPLATVLALTVLQFTSTVKAAQSASRLSGLISVSTAAAQLADDLQQERTAAVVLILGGAGKTAEDPQDLLNSAERATDEAVTEYRDRRAAVAVPAGVANNLADIDRALKTLGALRQQGTGPEAVASAIALRYEVVVTALNTYRESVAQQVGQSGAGNEIRAATMLSEAKQDVAYEQALTYIALRSGQFGADVRQALQAAQHGQEQALLTFVQTATTAQQMLVNGYVTGDAVQLADALIAQLSRATTAPNVDPNVALAELGSVRELMRGVEVQLDDGVTGDVNAYQAQVVRQATMEGIAVTLAIVLALLITVLLARMMSRSLSRLRVAAENVSQRDLPQSVAVLQDPRKLGTMSPREAASRSYRPIPILSTDEIGQVATAFNGVQREAIRIAVEQAILRNNVSATFVNLARRSQKLVDKMIANLDGIERDEEEPERLAQLFELDHLATRMRRNDENLLILADADAASPRAEDAALADVLAAAQSEIAHYDRIEFGPLNIDADGSGDVTISSSVVNDIVRLFAELLENAASFSSPDTRVMVAARRVADRMIVEIEDHGIGMTQERRERINEQLAHPAPTASGEPGALRMMGFAVVSKLAARHHIHIELGSAGDTGTVVHVVLPPSVLSEAAPLLPGGRRPELPAPPAPRSPAPAGASRTDAWPATRSDPRTDSWDSPTTSLETVPTGRNGNWPGRRTDEPPTPNRPDPRPDSRTDSWLDSRTDSLGGSRSDLRTEGWPAPPPADATMELPAYREQTRDASRLPARQEPTYREPTRPEPPYRDPGHSDLDRSDLGRSDLGRSDLGRSDLGRSDLGRSDLGRSDLGRSDLGRREVARREPGRAEPGYRDPAAFQGPASDWFSSPTSHGTAADAGPAVPAPALPAGRPNPLEETDRARRSGRGGRGGRGQSAQAAEPFERPAARSGWPEPPAAPAAPPRGPAPVPAHHTAAPRHARPGLGGTPEIAPITWHTRADAGWQAARRVTEAPEVTATHHGLPKRNPMAHLVPGSAGDNNSQAPVVARRPESVRSVLTEYQRGVRNGRHQYAPPGPQPARDANHVQER
jgi:signal transduction histidine kinase